MAATLQKFVSVTLSYVFLALYALTIIGLIVGGLTRSERWVRHAGLSGYLNWFVVTFAPISLLDDTNWKSSTFWITLAISIAAIPFGFVIISPVAWAMEILEAEEHRITMRAMEDCKWFGRAQPAMLSALLSSPSARGFNYARRHFSMVVAVGRAVAIIDTSGDLDSRPWRASIKNWSDRFRDQIGVDVHYFAIVPSIHPVRRSIDFASVAVSILTTAEAVSVFEDFGAGGPNELYVPLLNNLLVDEWRRRY